MELNKSLLTQQQSLWMKGFLILLIVLGHNSIIMGRYEGMQEIALFGFLYTFHVYLFFYVRAMYDWKPICVSDVKRNFLKIYKPYTIWFILVLAISLSLGLEFSGFKSLTVAYITGSEDLIKDAIGMAFIWFLPTMFFFTLLIGLYARRIMWLNILILTLSFGVVAVTSVRGYSLGGMENVAVSGSFVALRMFGLSVMCRWLYERYHGSRIYQLLIVIFTVAVVLFYLLFIGDFREWRKPVKFGLLPLLMFQFAGIFIHWMNRYGRFILFLGKHSLEIYLIHMIMYNVLIFPLKIMHIQPTLIMGIGLYILTLVLTIAVNYAFARLLPKVYKFVFSKNYG